MHSQNYNHYCHKILSKKKLYRKTILDSMLEVLASLNSHLYQCSIFKLICHHFRNFLLKTLQNKDWTKCSLFHFSFLFRTWLLCRILYNIRAYDCTNVPGFHLGATVSGYPVKDCNTEYLWIDRDGYPTKAITGWILN